MHSELDAPMKVGDEFLQLAGRVRSRAAVKRIYIVGNSSVTEFRGLSIPPDVQRFPCFQRKETTTSRRLLKRNHPTWKLNAGSKISKYVLEKRDE
jgi:hypothetical protein